MIDPFMPYEKDVIVIEKNSTSAIFAPGFLETIKQMKNVKKIIIGGVELDICVFNLAVPLKNYLNQQNRQTEVIVLRNIVETYDAPHHPRANPHYSEAPFVLMEQAGIQLVKKYR